MGCDGQKDTKGRQSHYGKLGKKERGKWSGTDEGLAVTQDLDSEEQKEKGGEAG